ncbi:MAG: hypothetical protein L3J35_06755 [Bacteroidales bacterium]|nr:hypothetical protein [Bacteroidales bacterium]
MKKILSVAILSVLIFSTFTGCKKGSNDSFSLLSRKARITGVWNLTNADYEEKDVNSGDTEITSFSFDGANMTETVNGDGQTYKYSEKLTIDKDGTFKVVTEEEIDYWDNTNLQMAKGIREETMEGVWYFLDGNDALDVKNKERVEFLIEKFRQIDPDGDTFEYELSGKSNNWINIFLLDRLAKDEIVTLFDFIQTMGGDSFSKTGTKTYTKEK